MGHGTRERTWDWRAIIHEGGPRRGFSEIMPAFGDALTLEQIDKAMAYLREQCPDPTWPLGELNLPRPLFTEKAFPEDEWVLQTSVDVTGDGTKEWIISPNWRELVVLDTRGRLVARIEATGKSFPAWTAIVRKDKPGWIVAVEAGNVSAFTLARKN